MIDMIMPQMGESIVEGTIVRWRKRVGETVQKDEMILEISTDKVDSEIPSPANGVLQEILVEEGKTVAVGTVIARLSGEGAVAAEQQGAKPQNTTTPATAPARPNAAGEKAKKFLSPLVKKIAQEHNISPSELERMAGTGLSGRVSKNDILSYIEERPNRASASAPVVTAPKAATSLPQAAPVAGTTVATADNQVEIVVMDHVRKKIAEHMVFSKHTAPHVTSVAEVDVTRIVKYREKVKAEFEKREGAPLTFTAFFVQAAAQALRDFPLINASLEGDNIIMKKNIHVGIAVGLDKGLIVPVIKNADRLSLVGIAQVVYDLASRARQKQLQAEEVKGGTFTITNIGTFGNLFGTPIINQPQVAIMGTGAIKKRPVVIEDDAIAVRSMMYLSLTYDHRIIDGLYGGSFLQRVVQNLENLKLE
jgi:2-oxoglutarate dehydrogenase complex dihydrolipoamide succinyltransferase (E2) component